MSIILTSAGQGRTLDARQLLAQIGRGNLAAISGGRALIHPDGVVLPVAHGYRVEVFLQASDTYVVRRVFIRGAKYWVKGEETGVYADAVGDAAYRASCYVNVPFGEHDPNA